MINHVAPTELQNNAMDFLKTENSYGVKMKTINKKIPQRGKLIVEKSLIHIKLAP